MADVETTIKSSGGDYASLSLAEADDFGCTSGQSALCEYAEEMTDTTAVTINTSVPGSIEISVQSSYRHEGYVSAGAVLAPSSGSDALKISAISNVTIRHLRIDCTNITASGVYFYNINGNSNFNHLFVHDIQSGDHGIHAKYNSGNSVTGYRSICSGSGSSQIGFYASSSASMTLYFCTSYSYNYVSYRNDATMACYACIGFGSYPFFGTISGDYNADNTSNSTYQAPGSNSQNDLTVGDELTDVSSDDFSVKSDSTGAKENGYDYGTPYTDADIAGNSMSSTPDIGAFEYSLGSSILPINFHHYNKNIGT